MEGGRERAAAAAERDLLGQHVPTHLQPEEPGEGLERAAGRDPEGVPSEVPGTDGCEGFDERRLRWHSQRRYGHGQRR